MIKINLVPADILAKVHQRQQMLQASAGGILVAALVVMASLSHLYKLSSMQRHLTEDQVSLKRLQKIVDQVEELKKNRDEVKARLSVVQNLLKGRTLYPVFMSKFVATVPEGVRVKTLSTTGGGSAGGELKLAMTAEARTDHDIADWIKRLEESGRFSAVELGPVTATVGVDETMESFTLNAGYTAAP